MSEWGVERERWRGTDTSFLSRLFSRPSASFLLRTFSSLICFVSSPPLLLPSFRFLLLFLFALFSIPLSYSLSSPSFHYLFLSLFLSIFSCFSESLFALALFVSLAFIIVLSSSFPFFSSLFLCYPLRFRVLSFLSLLSPDLVLSSALLSSLPAALLVFSLFRSFSYLVPACSLPALSFLSSPLFFLFRIFLVSSLSLPPFSFSRVDGEQSRRAARVGWWSREWLRSSRL